MRHLYPQAKYDIGDVRYELVTVSDTFVVIKVDEQEMVMPRDLFEQQATFVRRFYGRFIYGIHTNDGVMRMANPGFGGLPVRLDGHWCIDLDKVPEEAYVQGWNP